MLEKIIRLFAVFSKIEAQTEKNTRRECTVAGKISEQSVHKWRVFWYIEPLSW